MMLSGQIDSAILGSDSDESIVDETELKQFLEGFRVGYDAPLAVTAMPIALILDF
jgi:hypothetical protein